MQGGFEGTSDRGRPKSKLFQATQNWMLCYGWRDIADVEAVREWVQTYNADDQVF